MGESGKKGKRGKEGKIWDKDWEMRKDKVGEKERGGLMVSDHDDSFK